MGEYEDKIIAKRNETLRKIKAEREGELDLPINDPVPPIRKDRVKRRSEHTNVVRRIRPPPPVKKVSVAHVEETRDSLSIDYREDEYNDIDLNLSSIPEKPDGKDVYVDGHWRKLPDPQELTTEYPSKGHHKGRLAGKKPKETKKIGKKQKKSKKKKYDPEDKVHFNFWVDKDLITRIEKSGMSKSQFFNMAGKVFIKQIED